MSFLFTWVILRFQVSFSGCKAIQTNFVFVSFSAGNKTSMPKCHHARCGECTYPSVHLDYWWLRRFLIPSLIKTIPILNHTLHVFLYDNMGVSKNGGTQQPWVFLLKMINYGGVLGCHQCRKHPYICIRTRNVAHQQLTTLGLDFLVAALDVVLNCSWRLASWFNGCFLVPLIGGR